MVSALLVRGFILGFTIAAAVGPISLLVIRRTLAEGRVIAGYVAGESQSLGFVLPVGFRRSPGSPAACRVGTDPDRPTEKEKRTVNKVLLTGRLTRDPELRSLASGKSVTTFNVATNQYTGARGAVCG